MSPERWQQVKDVFHSALGREPALRAAFLAGVCAGDDALRAEVESLIAAHESDPGFIELPAAVAAELPDRARTDSALETLIGPYRLVRRIGMGGMGAVYLAVRADDAYRKQVAVKLLRGDRFLEDDWRREELLRRFRTERQTLANLDHPHIARLLDGGTSDDGRPYLVMDHIEGRQIDEYCDAGRLSTAERLKLFRTVCGAVQYAHQHLVVHRDLKPSNILVTAEGTPRLLDFGIVKLLDADADAGGAQTRTAAQPMTPLYASPEQIRGENITTASDVYSLGVILYELLTGHRPYRLGDVPEHEFGRVICEQQPARPSTAVMQVERRRTLDGSSWITLTPRSVSLTRGEHLDRLRRRLAGDLDMIVLKALRKEPDRRYASAEQLSEDIRRHLNGLPVTARPDTLVYRAGKFVRRHAVGVGLCAVTVLTLALATAITARSAREARRQRDSARLQQQAAETNLTRAETAERDAVAKARTTEEVVDFLVGLFDVADPFAVPDAIQPAESDLTPAALLERGTRMADELEDQPVVQAAVLDALGRVHLKLGLHDEAEPLLRRGLELRQQLYGDEHPAVAYSLFYLADWHRATGDWPGAEQRFREVLALRRKLLEPDDPGVIFCLSSLGGVLEYQSRHAEAEQHIREALELARRRWGERHHEVGLLLGTLSNVLRSQGQYGDEPERYQLQAIELLREEYGDEHPVVANRLSDLADLYKSRREYDKAVSYVREALGIHEKVLPAGHPLIAVDLANLGTVLTGAGEYEDAERTLRRAIEQLRRVYLPEHPFIAQAVNNLGQLLARLERFDEAEQVYQEALELQQRTLPGDHRAVGETLNGLGRLHLGLQQYAEAESCLRRALEIRRGRLSDEHPQTLATMNELAVALFKQEKLEEAERLCAEAVELCRAKLPEGEAGFLNALTGLIKVLAHRAKHAESLPLLREKLQLLHDQEPAPQPDLILTLRDLGAALLRSGDAAAAEPVLRECLEQVERDPSTPTVRPPDVQALLGECLALLGRHEEAEPLLLEGFAGLRDDPKASVERRRQTLVSIVQLYEAWGKPEDAAEWRAELSPSDGPAEPAAP